MRQAVIPLLPTDAGSDTQAVELIGIPQSHIPEVVFAPGGLEVEALESRRDIFDEVPAGSITNV